MRKDTKQTAVEWLFDQIPLEWTTKRSAFEAYKQALEKEKEQIINAWIATDNKLQRLAAEQYYNQTYNK